MMIAVQSLNSGKWSLISLVNFEHEWNINPNEYNQIYECAVSKHNVHVTCHVQLALEEDTFLVLKAKLINRYPETLDINLICVRHDQTGPIEPVLSLQSLGGQPLPVQSSTTLEIINSNNRQLQFEKIEILIKTELRNLTTISNCHVSRDVSALLSTPRFSDVKLILNDTEELRRHKTVLSDYSKRFARLFSQYPAMNIFHIYEVNAALFREMIQFLYSGEIDLDAEKASSLYNMADRYEVDELMSICNNFLNGPAARDEN